MPKVACIIPARNEAKRLGAVLAALKQYERQLDQIVVVANGCSDDTAYSARQFEFKCRYNVIERATAGKYEAMAVGVASTDADILLFLDADLRDLRSQHLHDLLQPVVTGQAAMSCAILHRPWPIRRFLVKRWAWFTGQRALQRYVWNGLPHRQLSGYEVEAALNSICRINHWHVVRQWWPGVKQFGKRSKLAWYLVPTAYARTYIPAFATLAKSRLPSWR